MGNITKITTGLNPQRDVSNSSRAVASLVRDGFINAAPCGDGPYQLNISHKGTNTVLTITAKNGVESVALLPDEFLRGNINRCKYFERRLDEVMSEERAALDTALQEHIVQSASELQAELARPKLPTDKSRHTDIVVDTDPETAQDLFKAIVGLVGPEIAQGTGRAPTGS